MEEPSDRLNEKQKHGRSMAEDKTSLAFGSGWTDLGCIYELSFRVYLSFGFMDTTFRFNEGSRRPRMESNIHVCCSGVEDKS